MIPAARFTAIALLLAAPALGAAVEEKPDGTTNLPVPRFVSLKRGQAYMRTGPEDRFPIQWVYVKKGLPVEIVREYGIWRQVRDPDGVTGWMNKQLLSGERSGIVTGGVRTLYVSPDLQSRIAWRIEPGTIVQLTLCEGAWCRVQKDGKSGYILRAQIWGSYPNETVNG